MQHAINRIIFIFTIILHVALQIEAKSPVSEKEKRISNIEYNGTLKYETTFLRKPPSFLTPNSYSLTPKTYVAAAAITAANAGVQAYVAGETGGGNNGAIAGAANAAISTITAGAGSAFTGYVSWTPHRTGNLFTGEDAVAGGWGGGISGSFQGTSGLLKGVGLTGGLSFQPGSGVGVNLNVNFPGTLGLPKGTFLGVNYQTGSGNYTASGGFNIYQNGNSSTGISLSASNSGYTSVGLNYNKDGSSFLNRLQGYSLNIGSDGLLSLHNQFRGADVLSLGYNFNTHTFDPIGINQNFQNDYNNSVTQENAAANAAASAEKLAEKRQEWLDQQRTKPGYEGLSDQAVFDKYKLENSGVGGSRLDLPSQVFGSLGDMFGGSLGLFNSSGEGYLNSQGEFVPRTCFTAGTLVHTKSGTKKIEEVKVGDQVLSWDEESGEVSYKAVTELFVHDINHLFDVEVNFEETFHTTWNHPFWLVNERSWVQVKDLKVGDIVLLKDGSSVPITKISAYSVSTTSVYNLEIEETHSYYVGKGGVLVHNYAIPLGARILHALVTAGIAYCSSNNCGGVINSNGNPNENKPELPALPRDPSLTQNEAEQMRRQGLNPMNSNDIQKFFDKISKDYKFASKEELAKRLNVNEKDIHIIKKEILKDFSIALTKNGMGTNPDIGWDTKGNLLLKDRTTGKVLNTYIPLEYYKD